jgi:predicted enzyme related to lactoylglutathione lyase
LASSSAKTLSYDLNGHQLANSTTIFFWIGLPIYFFATGDRIVAKGGKLTRNPGAMKHGTTVIAFVEDPSGYKVELIQLVDRA